MVAVKLYGGQRTRVRKRAARLYETGHSMRDIAARVGYSYGTVRVLLDEAGVSIRSRGRVKKT